MQQEVMAQLHKSFEDAAKTENGVTYSGISQQAYFREGLSETRIRDCQGCRLWQTRRKYPHKDSR